MTVIYFFNFSHLFFIFISNFLYFQTAPSKPPKSVSLVVTGSRSIRLNLKNLDWNDRNGIITLFSVRLENETGLVKAENFSSINTGVNITGLLPYSNYSAKAAAINSAGFGPYSETVSVRTMEEGAVLLFILNLELYDFFIAYYE